MNQQSTQRAPQTPEVASCSRHPIWWVASCSRHPIWWVTSYSRHPTWWVASCSRPARPQAPAGLTASTPARPTLPADAPGRTHHSDGTGAGGGGGGGGESCRKGENIQQISWQFMCLLMWATPGRCGSVLTPSVRTGRSRHSNGRGVPVGEGKGLMKPNQRSLGS